MARTPSESTEAKALVRWLRRQPGIKFSKIAQETPTTPEAAAKNKAEGVVRGVPDYLIVHVATHRVLFVELKRTKGGRLSKEQAEWLVALGAKSIVALGYRDAVYYIGLWMMRCDRVARSKM